MSYNSININCLEAGKVLPEVITTITQEAINSYAKASGDCNPIHIDVEFARKTPLGGTIAHGMLLIAYISQMMVSAFGELWLNGGRLSVRFREPARPGDIITVGGKVIAVDRQNDAITARFDVYCQNQKGEQVITGEARVTA